MDWIKIPRNGNKIRGAGIGVGCQGFERCSLVKFECRYINPILIFGFEETKSDRGNQAYYTDTPPQSIETEALSYL